VFPIPDLESGKYTFLLSAADNYNNRTQAQSGGPDRREFRRDGFRSVAAYPNPFDPDREPTRCSLPWTGPLKSPCGSIRCRAGWSAEGAWRRRREGMPSRGMEG